MDAYFWHQCWENNDIGFHKSEANPLLVQHFKDLSLAENSRIFLPLCGKTLDISWLLSEGHRIVGAELSKIAVDQLFDRMAVKPDINKTGSFYHYSAQNIDIFVGDIFELSRDMLGTVDAIYDRAALIALPRDLRERYTSHLLDITDSAPQLLISIEYDQNIIPGPPFSVTGDELRKHYINSYNLTSLKSIDIPNGRQGKCPVIENVWLLSNR